MGNEVSIFELVKLDPLVKRFKAAWSKSFFVVIALFVGYTSGEKITESRIMSDCKYMNSFRIDISAYACNMRAIEK